jgi:hypothetical protein
METFPSSHTLEIEKGRHAKPKLERSKRVCKFCNVVEDELHFLINCTLYNNERVVLFDRIISYVPSFCDINDQDKFICLLT